MNGFIVAPAHNKPGRCDATGAFHLGAEMFQKIHGLPAWKKFENTDHRTADRQGFLELLDAQPGNWDVFAYFGHGDTNALGSADVRGRKGATALSQILMTKCRQGAVIILYACNTGKPGGFAQWLSEDLFSLDMKVFAHVPPPGHTFTNANVVTYPGGDELVPRSSPLWKDWYRDMHADANDLWARFPFMSPQELEGELAAPQYLIGRWDFSRTSDESEVVFFTDTTCCRTSNFAKFSATELGRWSVTRSLLTVEWPNGVKEEWPLPLAPVKQNVTRTTMTGSTKLKARRLEPPSMNSKRMFYGLMKPKQSKLITVR